MKEHVYKHTHTLAHTYTYTHLHTYTHIYTDLHTHLGHTHTHPHTHTHTHTPFLPDKCDTLYAIPTHTHRHTLQKVCYSSITLQIEMACLGAVSAQHTNTAPTLTH